MFPTGFPNGINPFPDDVKYKILSRPLQTLETRLQSALVKSVDCAADSFGTTWEGTWAAEFDNDVPCYQEIGETLDADFVKRPYRCSNSFEGGLMLFAASQRKNESFEPTASLKNVIFQSRKGWGQMSRVRSSGLLNSLDEQAIRVQEALFDFILTEGSYVKSIDLLVKHFVESPEIFDVLGARAHHYVFSNVLEIQNFSRTLMDMLGHIWKTDCQLDPSLMAYVIKHHVIHSGAVYKTYMSNYKHQVKRLAEKRRNKKFTNLVWKTETLPGVLGTNLESFLMMPVRRITHLQLLFKQVKESLHTALPSYAPVSQCFDELSQLAKECNDAVEQPVGVIQTHAIQEDFKFTNLKPIPVVTGNGHLVKDGCLTCLVGRNTANLQVILYRDKAFICNKKPTNTFEVVAYGSTDKLLLDQIDEKQCRFTLELPESATQHRFECSSRDEMQQWLKALESGRKCRCCMCENKET